MRTDSFSANNIPHRLTFERTRPSGAQGKLVIRHPDGASFSVSETLMSRILEKAGQQGGTFEMGGLLVAVTGNHQVFAVDPGEAQFVLKIN